MWVKNIKVELIIELQTSLTFINEAEMSKLIFFAFLGKNQLDTKL